MENSIKEVFLISKEEKKEIESIAKIILSVTDSFETFTADDFDGDDNDDKLESIEELRARMRRDIIQLEKSHDILLQILHNNYDGNLSVTDYELGK